MRLLEFSIARRIAAALQLPAVLQLQPQLVMLLQLASQLQLAAVDRQSEKVFSLVFMHARSPAALQQQVHAMQLLLVQLLLLAM